MIIFSTKVQRWTLVDGEGRPVMPGDHVNPAGEAFRLDVPFDVVTVGSEHRAEPTRLGVTLADGSHEFRHPSWMGKGWRWRLGA